ncbi:MAG TPA: hypothetical protein VK753_00550 [Xanthomonadaceae bacterium]|jgi:hypothetical protein|nr:hypothetical protein [Xanthomonadaceae bacterium]
MKQLAAVAACLVALPLAAAAQDDIQWHGYLDVRAVLPADETSWTDGGLGKSRFGGGDGLEARFGGAALEGIWQVSPSWLAVADAQVQADTDPRVGLLDAWLRYRPVSTTPWRWSAKFGAFFPPISLENDGVGWTSTWTLTPSAIDSWVGEELRTVGAEVDVEHRGANSTFDAGAALFGGNDPAGELLAARGWSLSDVTSNLGSHVREPDVYAALIGATVPVDYPPFTEVDHRLGWYADATWKSDGVGQLTLLRYDNRADPGQFENYEDREVFAWHTQFWSLGAKTRVGDVVLIAQAMDGDTVIEPVEDLYLDTAFHAGYLLAGWDRGAWRPALRLDIFSLRQSPDLSDPLMREHGDALTFALNWRPRDWLRLTGEVLRIDSTRDQRSLEGLDPHQIDNQVQLSARLLF